MKADIHTDVVDQGGLAGSYIPMTETRACGLLRDRYGLDSKLKRFATEKDDTFQVSVRSGQKFVLKIANPSETWVDIDFQNGILRHAKSRDPEIPIPVPIPNTNGKDMFPIADVDGSVRLVRMLSYIEGTPLCETDSNSAERVRIGRMLARLRLATEGFTHPGEDRQYAWDVQHLMTLEHLIDEVEEPEQRTALSLGLDRFSLIEPELRHLRRQVLHNDFSKSNIVVDHDDPDFVKGIIDFGDAVKTAIAVDVSTACLNQLPAHPHDNLFRHARDIVQGYLQVADLTPTELKLIPHLTMGRVVARALLTLWRKKLFPENETYIMRNTYQGWHQLDWFLKRSPDQISDILLSYTNPTGKSV